MKKFITPKRILIAFLIIILDLAVYLILGLLLIYYDDFYDVSEGEYWSLASMNLNEKITYISYIGWTILNIIALLFLIYYGVKKWRKIAS